MNRQGMHHQYAQKHAYGHGPFGPTNHEVRAVFYSLLRTFIWKKIPVPNFFFLLNFLASYVA
jgi:hypothetical protein